MGLAGRMNALHREVVAAVAFRVLLQWEVPGALGRLYVPSGTVPRVGSVLWTFPSWIFPESEDLVAPSPNSLCGVLFWAGCRHSLQFRFLSLPALSLCQQLGSDRHLRTCSI